MGPVAVQATWSLVNLHKSPESRLDNSDDPEEQERRLRLNTNSCHVWQEDGEHIELIKEANGCPDYRSRALRSRRRSGRRLEQLAGSGF